MASILYIDRLASDNAKTLGQAVNNALTYGFGLMVGFFINGYIYKTTGSFVSGLLGFVSNFEIRISCFPVL